MHCSIRIGPCFLGKRKITIQKHHAWLFFAFTGASCGGSWAVSKLSAGLDARWSGYSIRVISDIWCPYSTLSRRILEWQREKLSVAKQVGSIESGR